MTKGSLMLTVFAVDSWIHAELAASLLQGLMRESRHITLTFITGNRPVAHARNHAANEFLKSDAEWLVMVDHDTVPPPNFLEIIPPMERDNKFIAGLPYPFMPGCEGSYPYPRFALGWFEALGKLRVPSNLPPGWSTGYDFLGGGCLVVHRTVFERIPKPYFKTIIDDAEVRDIDTEKLPNSGAEDLYFTYKAKRAGFDLWTHSDFVCNHYKTIPLLAVMEMLQSVPNPDPALSQSEPQFRR
jgi:GT2 family glycosyltransferase